MGTGESLGYSDGVPRRGGRHNLRSARLEGRAKPRFKPTKPCSTVDTVVICCVIRHLASHP